MTPEPAEPRGDVKVSVVIATYRSGAGLDRLVSSLDAQSLPTSEWEAIFVDDGSPDDTYERLMEAARSRPHFRIARIPNSGWPCRPRNTGLDLAVGEYVGFMDHDDELYPDALRAAYAFAHAHRADALNGKEARSDDAGWASQQFTADLPQVLGAGLPFSALSPTNPHKLYRRAFLSEHGIRFREDGRVLWEDIFFNVDVLAKADVVATMASTPYYHWRTTSGSGSTTFRRAKPEWWYWLGEVLRAIDEGLADADLEHEHRVLREHQYRSRLVGAFNNAYPARAAAVRKLIFEHARSLQTEFFADAAVDSCLDVSGRLRATLLRKGHPHALDRLTAEDRLAHPQSRATGARWHDGSLEVALETSWQDEQGREPALREMSGRTYKDLSAPFRKLFGDDELDVTDEIRGAQVQLGVRSQRTRIGWLAETSSEPWLETRPTTRFGVHSTGMIDPRTGALRNELERGTWDLTAEATLGRSRSSSVLRGTIAPALHITKGGLSAAYTSDEGSVVLDLAPSPEELGRLLRPTGGLRRQHGSLEIDVATDDLEDGCAHDVTVFVRGDAAPGRLARQIRRWTRRTRSHPDDGWTRSSGELRTAAGRAILVVPDAGVDVIRMGDRHPAVTGTYRVLADSLAATRAR